MIYTVTFNPSLDYIVSVEDFKLGLTNRTSSELILPGGKEFQEQISRIILERMWMTSMEKSLIN